MLTWPLPGAGALYQNRSILSEFGWLSHVATPPQGGRGPTRQAPGRSPVGVRAAPALACRRREQGGTDPAPTGAPTVPPPPAQTKTSHLRRGTVKRTRWAPSNALLASSLLTRTLRPAPALACHRRAGHRSGAQRCPHRAPSEAATALDKLSAPGAPLDAQVGHRQTLFWLTT
jgi:hypothetical protein